VFLPGNFDAHSKILLLAGGQNLLLVASLDKILFFYLLVHNKNLFELNSEALTFKE